MNKFSNQNKVSSDIHNKASMTGDASTATAIPLAGAKRVQVTSVSAVKKGKWPQQVKAAKNQWGKLSEAEILNSDGNSQQLSGLVQKRYDIALDVAEKQVKTFLDKCNMA